MLALSAGAAVLLVGYALLSPVKRDPLPADGPVPPAGSPDELAAARPEPQSTVSQSDRSLLAPSLRGTLPDGALVVDASGRFVPTSDALDLFDYYLSAVGEQPLEQIVARIELEIRARLDPPDTALELLGQYLAYRDAVRELVATQGLDALSLERRLQRLREIRRGVFGAALAAQLFEEEETRAREAIAWREVALDPDLGPDERAERLAALEAQLPEAELQRRERATVAQRLLEQEALLRADGTSEAEIDARRRRAFGEEAAARLAALDAARAEWNARVADYRAERARLDASPFADEAEANAALEALRASRFEGPELLRIRALDAAETRAPR